MRLWRQTHPGDPIDGNWRWQLWWSKWGLPPPRTPNGCPDSALPTRMVDHRQVQARRRPANRESWHGHAPLIVLECSSFERPADALHGTSLHLSSRRQSVDRLAHILYRGVTQDRSLPRLPGGHADRRCRGRCPPTPRGVTVARPVTGPSRTSDCAETSRKVGCRWWR